MTEQQRKAFENVAIAIDGLTNLDACWILGRFLCVICAASDVTKDELQDALGKQFDTLLEMREKRKQIKADTAKVLEDIAFALKERTEP
jgi:hypothetical protein